MQVAERNIAERLDEMEAGFQHRRQHALSEEPLDVVSGFETLHAGARPA